MLLKFFWLGILTAACLSLAVIGMLQSRRSARLARRAHELGLRFSLSDLFDSPRRYGALALMRAGHSCRAHNVIYGNREGLPVRAFDFHYEVGHGTTRATRRYVVIIVETDSNLGELIMWNRLDRPTAPLEARFPQQETAAWFFSGQQESADAAGHVLHALAPQGVSCQSSGGVFLMCMPAHAHLMPEPSHFEIAVATAKELSRQRKEEQAAETPRRGEK